MNRSILIVICDFLLLSLLTFSTDITHMADENTRPPTKVAVATNNPAGPSADLTAMMRLALEEERKGRTQLQQQLQQEQQQLQQQAAQSANATSQAAQQQAALAARERENEQLRRESSERQTSLENLNRQLQATTAQAEASEQKLTSAQTEARREAQLADALQQRLDSLVQSNQQAQSEKQQLAEQLQVAEAERRAAADRAALMQQEVQDARAENSKLTEGIRLLATNSSQLTQEIRDNRPLAPNTVFNDFVSNHIGADIQAARTGVFGQGVNKDKQTQTIVVTDGTHYFALCHIQETPLTLWDPGTDWDKFTGTLSKGLAQVPIHSMAFNQQDPRVVMIPLTQQDAYRLGSKVYHLSSDPYKFQDAVLIGAGEDYYGECNFQIDVNTPQYVRLDRSFLKGLFGQFNPSRGDLVFSRTGEFLGIMVNDSYCLTIHNFAAGATFPFDIDLQKKHTGEILAGLSDNLYYLPQQLK